VVSIYGSIRYDDPVNLDFDVAIIAEHKDMDFKRLISAWSNQLSDIWDVGKGGHFGYMTLDSLQRYCDAIKNGESDYINGNAPLMEADFGDAASIINGYTGFTGNSDLVANYRQRILNMAYANPLMGASVALTLQGTLSERRSRRLFKD
jgi:hypothetical protein